MKANFLTDDGKERAALPLIDSGYQVMRWKKFTEFWQAYRRLLHPVSTCIDLGVGLVTEHLGGVGLVINALVFKSSGCLECPRSWCQPSEWWGVIMTQCSTPIAAPGSNGLNAPFHAHHVARPCLRPKLVLMWQEKASHYESGC